MRRSILPAAALALLLSIAVARSAAAAAGPASGWTLAGRLGQLQFIIVPEASVRDRAYYDSVIEQLCGAEGSCFLHFFTNSKGVTVQMPLPGEIYAETAARFQRSAKQGRQAFQFSCRLQVADADCF